MRARKSNDGGERGAYSHTHSFTFTRMKKMKTHVQSASPYFT